MYDSPQELVNALDIGTENYDSLPESIKSLIDAYRIESPRSDIVIVP